MRLRGRSQKRLAETNETEANERRADDPAGLEQARGKQLRVLSIRPI